MVARELWLSSRRAQALGQQALHRLRDELDPVLSP